MAVAQDDIDVCPIFLDDIKAIDFKSEVIGVLGRDCIHWHDVHNRILLILGCKVEQLLFEIRTYFLDLKVRIVECDDFIY
jgi:hypothetical protein